MEDAIQMEEEFDNREDEASIVLGADVLQIVPMDIDAKPKEDPLLQIKDTIKHTIIEIQPNWDHKGVTVELQKQMLNQIFGGLEASTNPANLDLSHEHRLGALIKAMLAGWKGDLDVLYLAISKN